MLKKRKMSMLKFGSHAAPVAFGNDYPEDDFEEDETDNLEADGITKMFGAHNTELGNLVDELSGGRFPMFSTLVTAVKFAGLVEELSNDSEITVLCPTNMAFKRAKIEHDEQGLNFKIEEKDLTKDDVKNLLMSHVIKVKNDDMLEQQMFETYKSGVSVKFSNDDDYRVTVTNSINNSACVLLQGFKSSNANFAAIGRVL